MGSVLEHLIPAGRSSRSTGSLCPDYAFLLRELCPFRGEEKPPGSREDPKAELSDKLAWAYDPAPYVLGWLMLILKLQYFRILITSFQGTMLLGPVN